MSLTRRIVFIPQPRAPGLLSGSPETRATGNMPYRSRCKPLDDSGDLAEEFSTMRLLQRAWTPLPVSALALSSTRGASKRIAAAATILTEPARTSACLSRGSLGGGRRVGDHCPHAARHLGREGGLPLSSSSEPLVQRISDELHSIRGDLEAHAIRGADSPVISKVLRLMDKLEPEDLRMNEGDFEGLECSLCIPVVIPDTSTNQAFEITVFVIPEGGEIPLHDHPHMTVLSKILFGSLHVESYDLVRRSGDDAGEDEPMTLYRPTSAEASAWTASELSGRRHEAMLSPPRSVGAENPPFLLTPSKGNVHAFKAPVTCAVFDILIPPYDIDRGRSCTFYRVETPDSSGNPELRSNTAEGAGGNQEEEDESRRVVLQEISEPEDLPRWGEYRGPVVNLP